MTRRLGGIAATVVLVAGCGDPSPSVSPPEVPPAPTGPTTTPSGTRVATSIVPIGDGDVAVTEFTPIAVNEPCPERVARDSRTSDDDGTAMLAESARLEPMLGVVLQYGSERPEVFGGYAMHWHGSDDASVLVSFTGELAEHRAALESVVEFPDELIVCQVPASERTRSAIQATLISELDGRYSSLGSGGARGGVEIGLWPDDEQLAAELVDRYGAAVDITVGALPYPLDEATDVCEPPLAPDLIEGLDVSIVEADRPLAPSEYGTVETTVRLTNTGTEPIEFGSGRPTVSITDAGGRPLALDIVSSPSVIVPISLEPGAHEDLAGSASLASCDPSNGYAVSPGDHFVVASLPHADLPTDLRSAPIPITIAG